MNEGLTPFAMWRERVLFLATAAALAGYVALWLVGSAVSRPEAGPAPAEQRYVRPEPLEPFPEGASGVFASPRSADSWDDTLARVWVEPKAMVVEAVETVELEPPPASVPAPPTLLPLPGPAPEFSGGLPRWPAAPAAAGGP